MKHFLSNNSTSRREASLYNTRSGCKSAHTSVPKPLLLLQMIVLALFLLLSPTLLQAATKTWVGGIGSGKNWTDGANWSGGVAPVDGDDIVFSTGSSGRVDFSIMPSVASYNSINANGYIAFANSVSTTLTIGGNAGTDLSIPFNRELTLSTNVTIILDINATASVVGTLILDNSGTYNTNSQGAVTSVTGTMINSGGVIVSSGTNLSFNSNSTYKHTKKGGTLPMATWHATSTCSIQILENLSTQGEQPFSSYSSFDQVFGNFIWNVKQYFCTVTLATYLKTVQGNLEIRGTGTSHEGHNNILILTNSPADNLSIGGTFTVGGYVVLNGGTVTAGNTIIYRNEIYKAAYLSVSSNTTLTVASLTVGPHKDYGFESSSFNPYPNFNLSGGTVTINGDLYIYPSSYYSCNNAVTSNIKGNITNNGSFSLTGGTVILNGTASQSISSANTTPTTFNKLTINNSSGITISTNVMVRDVLELISGKITTSSDKAIILENTPTAAITGADDTKYVNGNLQINMPAGTTAKTFPIGDATRYTPVTLEFSGSGTTQAGNITARTDMDDHPDIINSRIQRVKSVNRYWTLTNSGVKFGTYNATFNFNPGDVDVFVPATDPTIFIVQWYVPSTWYSTAVGTRTSTSIQITGGTQTQFGSFQVGEPYCNIPTVFIVSGGGSYCETSNPPTFAVNLSGSQAGVTYQLQRDGVNTGSPVAGDGNPLVFGPFSTAGTYTVVATRTEGGCYIAMSGSASISMISAPSLTASNNGPVCSGYPLTLSASDIEGATYSWAGPLGYVSSEQNPTVSTSATLAMDDGPYTVTALVTVTGGGTCPVVQTTDVTVNASPVKTLAKPASDIDITSFTAHWESTDGAEGYLLDVSDRSDFATYVPGYEGLDMDIPDTLKYPVSGLTPDITHYYRVRAYNSYNCTGFYQNIITVYPPARYESVASGNWNDPGTWHISSDGGSTWSTTTIAPSSASFSVSIRSGHIVTITDPIEIDQVTVEAGGTLINNLSIINSPLKINDGEGIDLLVNGIFISHSNIDNFGSISFAAGSLYQHIREFPIFPFKSSISSYSEIPLAEWDRYSTCEINSVFGDYIESGLDQEFGNFIWDFTNQPYSINLAGMLFNVQGNFTVVNTGGLELQLTGNEPYTLHIGGDLSVIDGNLNFGTGTGSATIDVTGSLMIGSGTLTLSPTTKLSVTGPTTLGSENCLVFNSVSTGTASFIDNGTINGPGTARIERYLAKYDKVSDYKFHFLSSPVGDAQPIQPEFSDPPNMPLTDFYKWDEPTNTWINYRGNTSTSVNGSFGDDGKFVPGKGYLVAYPDTITKFFRGKPYTNASGLAVNCTKSPSGGGWNLLGNPFPSAIDWDYIKNNNLTGVDAALYYYDNELADYRYYIPLTGGTAGATKNIPAMQGFMVHANLATGSVTLKNAARTHLGQDKYYKSAELTNNVLNVTVKGNAYSDQARVCFYDFATDNFDGEFDAYKLFSYNAKVPQLYSVTPDNTQLAINTLPFSSMYGTVPLGFKAGVAGTYTISAEGIGSFPAGMYIRLEDKKTGAVQNLNDMPMYSFTYAIGDNANRFVLHFLDATSVDKPEKADHYAVAVDNGVINVSALQSVNGQVNIIDMAGRRVGMAKLISGSPIRIDMQGHPGVYIVNIVTNQGVVNKKVVVR